MKKFYKSSSVVILLALSILLSIAMPIFFINSYESYDYSTGEEITIKGLSGLKDKKEKVQRISGILSVDKLNNALELYKSVPNRDKAYFKIEEEYPGIFPLLKEAYSSLIGSSGFQVSDIPNADSFYDRNIEKVEERIDLFGNNYLSNAEKQKAIKRALNIKKPYLYEFTDQWPILIKSLLFSYFAIVFSSIIISNQLFSVEIEEGMDIILTTAGRKKLISIGCKKVFAMLTYVTLEFLVCSILVSSIVFGLLGVSGWNVQIQMLPQFFTIIYDLSIGQMYLYYMLIAWISILCVALIGALINSIFQKTYTSIVISTLLITVPMFLKNSEFLSFDIQRFMYIQQINGVNLFSFIDSLFSYNLLSSRVLTSTAIILFSIACSAICIILCPYFFAQRINKN
ncbi:MAG: hypothetical protein RIN55_05795 [Tissierellaceae bacterium]|nr:hypothetical protein [Tissierellaceae bacterium]